MSAATTVFAERGVNGASVEEICESAGFTRGAFYSNFADKDALVLALIEAGMAAQYAAAEGALDALASSAPGAPPEELVSIALSRFDALGPQRDGDRLSREAVLVHQELMLHAARVPALRAPYAAFVQACTEQLRGPITDALDAAGLEFTVPFDEAIDLLTAAHDSGRISSLFVDAATAPTLRRMVLAITRPTAP
ncbi:TetR/AcrR family transcriptional regulator [uncultured Friedmanniella sp.]|uniref:TetR/AcrR family transcriptional regulator n=1 Tax=uncultured Friedmanniella sp. TaxID=335381 RepID=UPI0035C9B2E9